jgi:hypothetical protein
MTLLPIKGKTKGAAPPAPDDKVRMLIYKQS